MVRASFFLNDAMRAGIEESAPELVACRMQKPRR